MKFFALVLLMVLCVIRFAIAQNASPNPVNPLNRIFMAGESGYPTIQSAIAAAGATGRVIIPPTYKGTDTWTNPNHVRVQDLRPFNPNNTATFSSGVVPSTTIKAAEYGALCNGNSDDTSAIQNAVDALAAVGGGVEVVPPLAMAQGSVELPQGRCQVNHPIILYNYGSIQGSGNGTWITPGPAWSATAPDNAIIELVETYDQAKYHSQGVSTINRFVRNINFMYAGAASQVTGIKVYNQTGSTSTYPYPTPKTNPQPYQMPGVILEGNAMYSMDTAIDVEDCGECVIENNQIFYVRQGIVDSGNNYSLVVQNNAIQAGSFTYTKRPFAGPGSSTTNGVISYSSARYACEGGTGQACTGGKIAQTLITSPQGLNLTNNTFEAFDINAYIINCLGFIATANAFDNGGATSGVSNPSVFLGQLKFAQLFYNFMASGRTDSNAIEIAAATGTQGPGINNLDGVWLTGNFIYSYNPSSENGILFDSTKSGQPRRNVYITENQFFNWKTGISVQTPLTQSVIRGNYGVTNSSTLIYLAASGTRPFESTLVEDNTSPDSEKILTVASGSGYVVGYNQSSSQVTGTFVASGPGCTISSGAIGNTCATAATIVNPIPFADASYHVAGCSVVGAQGINVASVVSPPTTGGEFPVYETALSNTATGGGTIYCTVVHQ
jgi:parallel beta-helix repeat protein